GILTIIALACKLIFSKAGIGVVCLFVSVLFGLREERATNTKRKTCDSDTGGGEKQDSATQTGRITVGIREISLKFQSLPPSIVFLLAGLVLVVVAMLRQ